MQHFESGDMLPIAQCTRGGEHAALAICHGIFVSSTHQADPRPNGALRPVWNDKFGFWSVLFDIHLAEIVSKREDFTSCRSLNSKRSIWCTAPSCPRPSVANPSSLSTGDVQCFTLPGREICISTSISKSINISIIMNISISASKSALNSEPNEYAHSNANAYANAYANFPLLGP